MRWMWWAVPVAILAVGLPLAFGLSRGVVVEGPAVDVSFAELVPGPPRRVRLEGTAHLGATVTQKRPATWFHDASTHYVFGLFPKGEYDHRAIPVLVRTTRPPPPRVDFEDMVVEGVLGPITADRVSPSHEATLSSRTSWYFADDVQLLDAERVITDDDQWEEPAP